MALANVDNASLNDAEFAEQIPKLRFGGSDSADEEGSAEYLHVTLTDRVVPLNELGSGGGRLGSC